MWATKTNAEFTSVRLVCGTEGDRRVRERVSNGEADEEE